MTVRTTVAIGAAAISLFGVLPGAASATDYCVLNTARDALKEAFTVTVDRAAVRAVDAEPGDGERALAELESLGAIIA